MDGKKNNGEHPLYEKDYFPIYFFIDDIKW